MSASKEPILLTGALPAGNYGSAPPALAEIDPNNPPWSVLEAVCVWIASALLLLLLPMLAIVPYALFKFSGEGYAVFAKSFPTDKTAILISIMAIIPAHLLTLGLVWVVVTQSGRRPFWRTLGWDWSPRFGFWASVGLAFLLLVMGIALTSRIGGEATDLDQIINSSTAARFTTALLATATAPLVEEIIYRGLIYSALQRALGMVWAVMIVSALFASVHVFQYSNNFGVIAAISMLSLSLTLVRALTGRLLPCFVIHFIFNGLQAIYIIFEPYIKASGA